MIKNLIMEMRIFMQTIWIAFLLIPAVSSAQNGDVSGSVTNAEGQPITGVSVLVKGSSPQIATSTDAKGQYIIQVPQGAVLHYSFVGFISAEETVGTRSRIDVVLQADEAALEEVVVVGYGTQRKVTLTGAVSGIKGSEMTKTINENPQNMLTGRVPGVRVWQRSAEPGNFAANFDIRGLGSPLIVIDGVPRTTADFQRLNPNDIDDISVLKDASAAIYGVRAANGVILVTTKKGTKTGRTSVSLNSTYTFQRPSGLPVLADPYQTMTIENERVRNNIASPYELIYPESWFEDFRTGERRTTDWTSLIFSNYAPQTQQDLSITGGGDKSQYYVGVGHLYQEGFFKSGDLNYRKVNLRSNISAEITKGLSFDLNLSGIVDQRNSPYSSSADIIRNYWRQGVLVPAYADPENTMLNYEGLDLEENTVAKMTSDISGYRKTGQKQIQSSASLNYDFGAVSDVLQGLSAKALVSYDYRMDNNNINRREYYQYAFDQITESYVSKLYNLSTPNQIRREVFDKQQVLGQFVANYNREFNSLHQVTGMLGGEVQKQTGDNFFAQRNLAFAMDYLFGGVAQDQVGGMNASLNDIYETSNAAIFGRMNYTFANRYIAEAQFRYDGSSKFLPGRQWGFFPSASVAWRISEEPFFKNWDKLQFVNQLKLRASYGVLGDDGALQYDWATGYNYPATSDNAEKGYYAQYAPGYMFGNQFIYGVSTLALPNQLITWYTANTLNLGVDFEGWNGLFGFAVDYFERERKGLFARRTGDLPTVVGATAPRENLDSDKHFGMDVEISHRNKIGDLSYRVKAIGTITRQKYLVGSEKGPWGNSYDRWRNDNLNNRFQGMQFGYQGIGRYLDWDDIRSFPIYKGNQTLPGDYKYEDWNGDGEINGLDMRPLFFDNTPWLNFSFNFDASYKSFDLSFLFQGTALGSMQYLEPLRAIWGTNGGGILEQYVDRWHTVDPQADPWDPSQEWISGYYGFTGNYPLETSTFNRVSTAYLRLKSIELGYTLPKFRPSSTMNLRVFANAYNLFTITGVKFVDPEHPEDELGRLYPLNKTITAGLSLAF
ncbi:SusC/RagA family TonB-linked outer membrane protein [Sphingobacterium gobiense]|uniref:SusC/RagA family TonB-linked outer membrane protein n=1 Tax=Sphingobacterium gobiense TaxID=1382456 RepID=A0A2S9JNQ0_9SPHI|nr:TonB-dependent receptor [Sphingobacterium gobiense]PRD54783.1 SusC/RagA family TonB-linked outer membrane protein [Sphingobacterium gobiense]